ncbi:MAG: rRNA large subunit methyltransferase I, partial [Candidatus Hydrothermota bacterium]
MLTMRSVKVKGRSKDYIAHPWIFRDKVADAGDAQPGENVLVFTTKGAFIGSAIYNPKSKITLRFYSRAREELDYLGLKFRLMQADQVRQTLLPGETSYRMAFGESDDLPGLIIDRYENGFVIQILSLGMEIRRNAVLDALIDAFEPQFVYERSDSMLRIEEGLNQRSGLLYGELP